MERWVASFCRELEDINIISFCLLRGGASVFQEETAAQDKCKKAAVGFEQIT